MRRLPGIALCAALLSGCPGPGDEPTPSSTPTDEPSVPGFSDETPPGVQPMKPSRPVPEILREAEALGVQGPGFDDPEAELERLQNTPRKLLAEVVASGGSAIPELVAALATAQGYPDATGFRDRRAFVCLALGRVAHHDTAASFAAWAASSQPDQQRVLDSVRAGEQTEAVLTAWRAAANDAQRALLDAR